MYLSSLSSIESVLRYVTMVSSNTDNNSSFMSSTSVFLGVSNAIVEYFSIFCPLRLSPNIYLIKDTSQIK